MFTLGGDFLAHGSACLVVVSVLAITIISGLLYSLAKVHKMNPIQ
jgi:hypothetical protein